MAPVMRVGLLGGMSWESSVEYERMINQAVRERLGGLHSADLLVRSFDFARIEALQSAGDWDGAGRLLADAARELVAAGARLLALCTNTMHRVADLVEEAAGVPLLHIADATADAVRGAGVGTVGLLGTRYTMEQPFYRDRLAARHGLDVRIPGEADRALVHRVIYEELVQGVIRQESREQYRRVVEDLVAAGCQGVIAGCTEIELLLTPDDVAVSYFPTTRIHAEAIAARALAGDGLTP
jgi:aspartate racemase